MKTKLLSLLLFFAIAVGYSQVNSVALVGEAAGGWPGDLGNPGPTDVHQMTRVDADNWILIDVVLTNATSGGGVKFRANNAWETSWGSTAFPTGIGALSGANIPSVGGTYTVTFNSTTGAYHFEGPPIAAVKLVGTATSADVLFTTTDGVMYTASNVVLVDGTAQFNIDGENFGGSTFPSGAATEPSLLIPVTAEMYNITFNLSNGEYSFVIPPPPTISIVGAAVGGWPGEGENTGPTDLHQLTTVDNINYTLNNLTATDGEAKFRANNAWDLSWGDPTSSNGNIFLTAGTYNVTFNRQTAAFSFNALATTSFNASTFKAYPNPTNSSWTFSSANATIQSIQIVDVTGKVVLTVNAKNTVDASGLNAGLYFARIATATATQTVKLVKN